MTSRARRKALCVRKACVCVLILLPIAGVGFAIDDTEPVSQPMLPMVRAMGNAYTAVALDDAAVFYNPAGYALIEEPILTVAVFDFSLNVDESALSVYRAVAEGAELGDADTINKYLNNTTLAFGLTGPIYFGRVGNNFGFAFYNNARALLDTTPGALEPFAEYYAYSDLGFVGGFGYRIARDLYAGINLKVILRLKSELEGTAIEVIEILESDGAPIAKSVGFGSDLGLLYYPLAWLSVGLGARDFFGTRFITWEDISGSSNYPSSMIKPRLNAGLAFFPLHKEKNEAPKNDIIFALDYVDILDTTSILSHIKFGILTRTLGFLDLRAGIDGGYLTGGIGFYVGFFQFNVAYYVDELGAYAGASPVQNLALEFAFKW
jgi:hypothetical protein